MRRIIFTLAFIANAAEAQISKSQSALKNPGHYVELKSENLSDPLATKVWIQKDELIGKGLNIKKDTLKDIKKTLHGGSEGTGGGDTALDPKTGTRKLLDLIEEDEFEYFQPHQILPAEMNIKKASPLQALARIGMGYDYVSYFSRWKISDNNIGDPIFVFSMISAFDSQRLALKYEFAQFSLPPALRWGFTDLDLEDIRDEGVVRIENPETKEQLAIQSNGFVVVNREQFDLLSTEGKVGLFLHESVLRVVLLLNPSHLEQEGTKYVRDYTRRLVRYLYAYKESPHPDKYYGESSFPSFPLKETYDKFGIFDNTGYWK